MKVTNKMTITTFHVGDNTFQYTQKTHKLFDNQFLWHKPVTFLCDFAAVRSLHEQDTNLCGAKNSLFLAVLILLPCRFQPTEWVLQNTDHVNKVVTTITTNLILLLLNFNFIF